MVGEKDISPGNNSSVAPLPVSNSLRKDSFRGPSDHTTTLLK